MWLLWDPSYDVERRQDSNDIETLNNLSLKIQITSKVSVATESSNEAKKHRYKESSIGLKKKHQ